MAPGCRGPGVRLPGPAERKISETLSCGRGDGLRMSLAVSVQKLSKRSVILLFEGSVMSFCSSAVTRGAALGSWPGAQGCTRSGAECITAIRCWRGDITGRTPGRGGRAVTPAAVRRRAAVRQGWIGVSGSTDIQRPVFAPLPQAVSGLVGGGVYRLVWVGQVPAGVCRKQPACTRDKEPTAAVLRRDRAPASHRRSAADAMPVPGARIGQHAGHRHRRWSRAPVTGAGHRRWDGAGRWPAAAASVARVALVDRAEHVEQLVVLDDLVAQDVARRGPHLPQVRAAADEIACTAVVVLGEVGLR